MLLTIRIRIILTPLACKHGVILAGTACGDHVSKAVRMTAVPAGGAQDQCHKAPAGYQWCRPGGRWTRATWSG